MEPFQANMIIFLGLFLILLALLFIYWRFLRYRRKALERQRRSQTKAQKEGLEVPPDIAEMVAQKEEG